MASTLLHSRDERASVPAGRKCPPWTTTGCPRSRRPEPRFAARSGSAVAARSRWPERRSEPQPGAGGRDRRAAFTPRRCARRGRSLQLIEAVLPAETFGHRSRGRMRSTSSVASGASAPQADPWNASVASAAVGNLPASSGAGPASSSASVYAGVVADHQHRPDIVGQAAQAREQVVGARAVQLALHAHLRVPERGLDPLERLARAAGSRAQHQLRLELPRAHVLGDPLRRPLAAPRQRTVVVRQLGVLPTRLGVPQEVHAPHRPMMTDPQPVSSWTTPSIPTARRLLLVRQRSRRQSTAAPRRQNSSDATVSFASTESPAWRPGAGARLRSGIARLGTGGWTASVCGILRHDQAAGRLGTCTLEASDEACRGPGSGLVSAAAGRWINRWRDQAAVGRAGRCRGR
jgi:hypothetical protein